MDRKKFQKQPESLVTGLRYIEAAWLFTSRRKGVINAWSRLAFQGEDAGIQTPFIVQAQKFLGRR